MNPRILELADMADMKAPGGEWKQYFAELIVRECADLTRWREKDMSAEQRIRLEIYREIKDHFGVKE
jgi:hypothetical protein